MKPWLAILVLVPSLTAPAAVLAGAGVQLGRDYPAPVVDHAQARQRTLMRFGFAAAEAKAQAGQTGGAGVDAHANASQE